MAMGQKLRYLFSRDYHLFKRLFKGHRGVLTHTQMSSYRSDLPIEALVATVELACKRALKGNFGRCQRRERAGACWSNLLVKGPGKLWKASLDKSGVSC